MQKLRSDSRSASALAVETLTRRIAGPVLALGALLVLASSVSVGHLLEVRVLATAGARAEALLASSLQADGTLNAVASPDLGYAVLAPDGSRVLHADPAELSGTAAPALRGDAAREFDGRYLVRRQRTVTAGGEPALLWLRIDLDEPLREVLGAQVIITLAGILFVAGAAGLIRRRLRSVLLPRLDAVETALERGDAAVASPFADFFDELDDGVRRLQAALHEAGRREDALLCRLASAERVHAVPFDRVPAALIRCADDGRILAVNPTAQRLFGLAPDARPALAALLPQLDPGDAVVGRAAHARCEHQGKPVAVHAQASGDDAGGWLLVVHDESSRVEAETALRAAEELHRRMLAACHEGVWILDRELRTVEVNGRLADFLDMAPADLLGRAASEFVHEDAGGFVALLAGALAGETVAVRQVAWRRADGGCGWTLCTVTALPEGRRGALMLLLVDVTALKLTEESLRQSEQRLAMAAANGSITLWEYDCASDALVIDPRLSGLLAQDGAPRVGTLGALLALCHPDDAGLLRQAIARHVAGRTSQFEAEFRMREAQGDWRWLRAQGAVSERDAAGRARRVVGIQRDVTTEKMALEGLAAARDEAVRTTQVKSLFLANMSHELRTPLNGVLGMLTLLEHERLSIEQREFVDVAVKSGRVLFDLINEVLDFSKIEAGALRLERVEFDLHALAEDVVDMLAENAHQRGLDLVLHWDYTLPRHVECDAARLRQVLLNLLGNAVKFTDRGHVALSVHAAPDAEGIVFDVSDTGIGIAPGQQSRIFEPFKQGEETTTRRWGGTGLGLSISRQLVELMGGRLALESTPGAGSRFWFGLPLTGIPALAGAPLAGPLAGQRILLQEDTPVVLEAAAAVLRAHGACVDCVPDLREIGVKLSAAGPYDLLMLAVGAELPKLAGEIAALRTIPGCASLPVIGTLAFGRRGGAEERLALGVQGLLTKPLREARLLQLLSEVLAPGNLEALAATLPRPRATPGEERRALAELAVLVVDDVATNLKVASGMLGKLGIRATLAESGRAALDALSRDDFRIVFMDCQMPGMDGFETTALIRARYRPGEGPRIIAMTAHAASTDRDRCLASGMDDYLAKPVLLSDLERVLHRWVSVPSVAQATAAPRVEPVPLDGVDRRKLAELAAVLGPEQFDALYERFRRDGRAQLSACDAALARADENAARRALHALKGAAANVGAVRLSMLCGAAETRAPGELQDAMSSLTAAFDQFCATLEAEAAVAA